MNFIMLVVKIILVIIFVIPLFQIFSFSVWGGKALVILGIANYLYFLSKSTNLMGLVKGILPLVVFLLYVLLIRSWGDKATGHPLGVGLAAAFLVLGGMAVLVGYLEIITTKHMVADVPKMISLVRNWQGMRSHWLLLAVLLPLGAHLYVLFQGGLCWYSSEPREKPRIIRVQDRSVAFENDGLRLEGNVFQRTVREGRLEKPTVFLVGKESVLFLPGKPVRFFADGSIRSGTMENDTFLMVGGERLQFAANYPAEFYPDGNVKKGLLAQDLNFDLMKSGKTITVPQGRAVSFFKDGSPRTLELNEDTVWETGLKVPLLLKARRSITLYQDGTLASGILGQETPYQVGDQKVTLKNDLEAAFYQDGSLKQGTIVKELSLPIGVFPPGTLVLLGREGELLGFKYLNDEFYLKPDGKMLCKRGNGFYIYQGEKLNINNQDIFVQYGNREIEQQDLARDNDREINAIGYYYQRDCIEILNKNGIEILPEHEETVSLVMLRYKNVKKKIIQELLFPEQVIIRYRGKNITCPPYEWVTVGTNM